MYYDFLGSLIYVCFNEFSNLQGKFGKKKQAEWRRKSGSDICASSACKLADQQVFHLSNFPKMNVFCFSFRNRYRYRILVFYS